MSHFSFKEVGRIVLYGMGLGSIAALIFLVGPLVSIHGYYPLQTMIGREIAILAVGALFASVMSFQWRRRKKAAAKIAEGIAASDKPEDDSGVLKDKMKDALATLKTASGGKGDFLYDLPWYLLIGPPGSGKTTALVNSGLKFPLSSGATPAAIAGVGGTRYCDWWFTEDAVLIDTAGRYTTQDSDAQSDKQSWLAFLDLLKKNRPHQPINGVMVAVSLEDLLTLSPSEIKAHADAIRARLLELHERLKVDFPVYAVFTKSDLIAGFMEYFANLSDQGRRQVWGTTFQTAVKTRNMVGEIPAEFDALVERLNSDLTDRLQEEPTPSSRVLLYGFPPQVAGLKRFATAALQRFSELADAQRRTLERVLCGALLDHLVVLQQPHRERRHVLRQLRQVAEILHEDRLADHQRGVQAASRDEVGRLKLPVGKHAVDHFEAERDPLRRLEHRDRVARRRHARQLEYELRLDLRRNHRGDRQRAVVPVGIANRVVVEVRPDQRFELQRPPHRLVGIADFPADRLMSFGATRRRDRRLGGVGGIQIDAAVAR